MNIIKNLSNDIQEIIYNEYLEKQRDYHINQYKNRIKLLYLDKLKDNISFCYDESTEYMPLISEIEDNKDILEDDRWKYYYDYCFKYFDDEEVKDILGQNPNKHSIYIETYFHGNIINE